MQNRREFLRAAGLTAGAALASRQFAEAQASVQKSEERQRSCFFARAWKGTWNLRWLRGEWGDVGT